jgi:plastocyanin
MRRWAVVLLFAGVATVTFGVAPARGGGMTICDDVSTQEIGSVVEMVETCFTPTVLVAGPGTVTFVNRDDLAHDVSAYGWGPYVRLGTDGRSEVTFDRPGIYPYACSIHPGMTGAIVVAGRSAGGATASNPVPYLMGLAGLGTGAVAVVALRRHGLG